MRKVGEAISDKRIKFKKGYQRRFLEQVKSFSGRTWKELSNLLDVCDHTILFDWRTEKSTLPFSIAKKLIGEYPFENWKKIRSEWIEDILEARWGQKMIWNKNKKKIHIPEKNEELSELLGIILGDGNLARKTLTITGNLYEKGHHCYITKIIKDLFGIETKSFDIKKKHTTILKVYSTELISYLSMQGFVTGNKIKNKVRLPRWIFENEKFIFSTLRGLFDTDGGIYQKDRGYKRAIIEFQTRSPMIRKDIAELLYKGGFKPSSSSGNIRIQEQREVMRFLELIGSSNPKNIARINHFIKNNYIPLKEKLNKKIAIIKVDKPYKAVIV